MTLAPLRACLRIARRDARRAPGRSALVLLMVALPIIGMTSADVLFRTAQLDTKETISRDLGTADVVVTRAFGDGPITQNVDGSRISMFDTRPTRATPGPRPRVSSGEELARLVPGVQRLLIEHSTIVTALTPAGGQRMLQWVEFEYADPLARGTVRQVSGRAPRTTDEVVVTRALARSLDLHIGGTLRVTTGNVARITGIVLDPHSLRAQTVIGLPGSAPRRSSADGDSTRGGPGVPDRVYVRTSAPVTWADVRTLNQHGVLAVSRSVMLDPPPNSQIPGYDANYERNLRLAIAGIVLLVVGLATLEVVLLAGAAFAVGARRQRRALALVSVAGGEPRHVRRIVLAGGLLLGIVGAALGAVVGVLVALFTRSWFERSQGTLLGHFEVRPLEIIGVLAVGAMTGLLAAMVPARGAARADVVAVLAGRAGTRATPMRVPAVGVVLVGSGIALAAVGEAATSALGSAKWILGGTALVQIGALILTPAIVATAGRLGGRLPLATRLAVRDAARHRGRTAPAVGAVMAAVAGSTALAVYILSDSAHTKRTYQPTSRIGTAYAQVDQRQSASALLELRDALAAELPTRSAAVVGMLGCNPGYEPTCTHFITVGSRADCKEAAVSCGSATLTPAPLVGGVDVLRTLIGRRDPVLEHALLEGKAIVFAKGVVKDGQATLERNDEAGGVQPLTVPAVEAAALPGVQMLVPSQLADTIGGWAPTGVFIDTIRMPTNAEEDQARAALAARSPGFLQVERGVHHSNSGALLALLLGTTVITLGAAGVATGLAAADGRADMATLSAIGAAPRTRRRLAGAQAFTVATLGTVLGVAVGFVPAIAYINRLPGYTIVVPWSTLLLLVVGVPLSAALLATALTRSRLPLIRRAA